MSWKVHLLVIGFLALAIPAAVALAMPPSRPLEGPQLLCFKYSTFRLAEHEQVTGFSSSVESMSLTIRGPSGTFRIGESEIWAEPKRKGRLVLERDGTAVYRASGRKAYAIYGRTNYSPNEVQLVIWLTGDALRGGSTDRGIYSRFEVLDPEGADCGHGFAYGWEHIFGE